MNLTMKTVLTFDRQTLRIFELVNYLELVIEIRQLVSSRKKNHLINLITENEDSLDS